MKRYTFEKHLKVGDRVTKIRFELANTAHKSSFDLEQQNCYIVSYIHDKWATLKDNKGNTQDFHYSWIELYSTKIPTKFHNSCSCNEYWDMLGIKR